MDYEVLRKTIEVTLEEVAFKVDENNGNISILGKAQQDLKQYLEENTSISDDEKAKRYSEFLTTLITNVTTQAIMVAGSMPLQDAQVDTLRAESVQKILSMQNDDKAKLNNSAVNVAKAKSEIETLMPAQITQMQKESELKDAQIKIEEQRLPLMEAETFNELYKSNIAKQQVRYQATEVQYKLAQIKAIQKASEVNKAIETAKNTTNIKIAKIHAG